MGRLWLRLTGYWICLFQTLLSLQNAWHWRPLVGIITQRRFGSFRQEWVKTGQIGVISVRISIDLLFDFVKELLVWCCSKLFSFLLRRVATIDGTGTSSCHFEFFCLIQKLPQNFIFQNSVIQIFQIFKIYNTQKVELICEHFCRQIQINLNFWLLTLDNLLFGGWIRSLISFLLQFCVSCRLPNRYNVVRQVFFSNRCRRWCLPLERICIFWLKTV